MSREDETVQWGGSTWCVGSRKAGMVHLTRTHDKHPPLQSEGDVCWVPERLIESDDDQEEQ